MLKYPLFLICFILLISCILLVLLIASLIMILRGVLWDFKFQLRVDDGIYTFRELWQSTSDFPKEIWTELKSVFKL